MGIFVVIKNCIMTFLRNFFASCLGTLVAFGIAFFMIFVLISALSDIESSTTIGDKVVLELDFQGYVKDRVADAAQDPFSAFADPSMGLDQMLLAIKVAKEDSREEALVLETPILWVVFHKFIVLEKP